MTARYPILADLDRPTRLNERAVDYALLAAIDLAGPGRADEQAELIEVLLARGQRVGLVGLVSRYHALPAAVQDGLRDRADELAGGLRPCVAVGSATRQTRTNAIALIAPGRFPALASLAAAALSDVDETLVNAAAAALANFVHRVEEGVSGAEDRGPEESDAGTPGHPDAGTEEDAGTPGRRDAGTNAGGIPDSVPVSHRSGVPASPTDSQPPNPQPRTHRPGAGQVADAVREALATFAAHQRLAVLDCAIRLADELADTLGPMLAQPDHPTGAAVQDRVMQSMRLGGAAAPFYFLALSVAATRQRFAGRIGAIRDPALVRELIRQAGRPRRRQQPGVVDGLAAVRQMGFMNQPGWWPQLDDELAGPTVQWISAIGADPASKRGWLTQLAREGSSAQQAAARREIENAKCKVQSAK